MKHVKAWGVRNKKTNLWKLEKHRRWPMCALNNDDPELIQEAAKNDDCEVTEIPDDYVALCPDISEAMIRRAKMLYWDVKIAWVKVDSWKDA